MAYLYILIKLFFCRTDLQWSSTVFSDGWLGIPWGFVYFPSDCEYLNGLWLTYAKTVLFFFLVWLYSYTETLETDSSISAIRNAGWKKNLWRLVHYVFWSIFCQGSILQCWSSETFVWFFANIWLMILFGGCLKLGTVKDHCLLKL